MSIEIMDAEQLEKAKMEDILVTLLFGRYSKLVLHGGTAIWRCYNGNRFSRDIDLYFRPDAKRSLHYREFSKFFADSGFAIKEKGYSKETDTMHFVVEGTTKMKVDINFKYKKGTGAEYTKVDGTKMVVLALTPEELLAEKIETYEDKLEGTAPYSKPEINDLYDIYYLTSIAKKNEKIVSKLVALVEQIKDRPPDDVRSLDHRILSGIAPGYEFMINKILEWTHDT